MRKFLIFILPFFLLTACMTNPQNDAESCELYYFKANSNDELTSIPGSITADEPEAMIRTIYSTLTSTDNKKLTPIITPDIKLQDVSISDTACTLTLSEKYLNIPEASKTAINACLVKSICSLSNIDRVAISCEGITNEFIESDFITETPRTHYDTYTINLYFANETSDGLRADREIISLPPDTTLEYAVVSRLLNGPASDKLKRAIPEGTRLNNVYVSEGICIIDFSGEFVTNALHDELSESITLYSVVNTITELPMIDSVKFLIDGKDGYGYAYYDISKPLTNAASLFNKK